MNNYWYIIYILMLLLAFIRPNKFILTIVKYSLTNKAIMNSISFILGACLYYCFVAIISIIICSILAYFQQTMLMFIQLLCLCYLCYVGITYMTEKKQKFSLQNSYCLAEKNRDIIQDGFIYMFSDFQFSSIIISVFFVFYSYKDSILDSLFLIVIIPIVCFLFYLFLIFVGKNKKIWNLIENNIYALHNLSGFLLIILTSTNLKNVLKW